VVFQSASVGRLQLMNKSVLASGIGNEDCGKLFIAELFVFNKIHSKPLNNRTILKSLTRC
jgi:hypothetical protein